MARELGTPWEIGNALNEIGVGRAGRARYLRRTRFSARIALEDRARWTHRPLHELDPRLMSAGRCQLRVACHQRCGERFG